VRGQRAPPAGKPPWVGAYRSPAALPPLLATVWRRKDWFAGRSGCQGSPRQSCEKGKTLIDTAFREHEAGLEAPRLPLPPEKAILAGLLKRLGKNAAAGIVSGLVRAGFVGVPKHNCSRISLLHPLGTTSSRGNRRLSARS
jgi:hypothetical protein